MNFLELLKKNWLYVLYAILAVVSIIYSPNHLPFVGLAYLFEKIRRLEAKIDDFKQKDPRSRK